MARHDQNQTLMIEMLTLLNRIETALVVRDPGSKISADAYDGLRKMLLQSSKNRRIHVSHLLSLSDSLKREASIDQVRDRVNDFLLELGVSYWSDTSLTEVFDVVEGDGTSLECIEPAVVEKLEDGRIVEVRRGTARRVPGPEADSAAAPEVEVTPGPSEESGLAQSVSTEQTTVEVTDVSPRNRRFVPMVVVSSVIAGFLIGLVASSGSDNSPITTTTTVAVSTSTTIDSSTTTTEAGQ